MSKQKTNKDKKEILTLSPRIVSNEINKKYIKRLEDLINLESCKNIALIGNYGSGKSSIIKTFFDEKKEYNDKALTITIGSYIIDDDISEDEDNKISTKEQKLVNRVEESILKQIIYRKKFSKFPKSSLIRYDKEPCYKKIGLTIIFLYSVWFVTYYLYKYYNKSILSFSKLYDFFGINGIFMSIILIFFTFKVVKLCVNKIRINKIKVKDCELELHQDTNSLFSRYLSEIVYYFQITQYNLIVFEDLDRFPPDIALKVIQELKELNTILNTSYGLDKIVFIYAIKDNLFENVDDKNKFYDYNLSILPISTTFNSEINLIGFLKNQKIYNELSPNIIGVVAKYVYDMRTLINIVNDYCLFKDVTNTKNYDKLFAMVVFKNYYYKDYNSLFEGNDVIKKEFETCETKRKELLNDLKVEKQGILEKIQKVKDEFLNNNKQLKELLLAQNIYKNGIYSYGIDYYYLNSNDRNEISKFLNDDFDIEILKNNEFSLRKSNGSEIREYEVFKEFGSKKEFLERYNDLNDNNRILKLESETKKIDLQMEKIKNKNVNEIFKEYFDKNELNSSENNSLLCDLIQNNYITDGYMDYITAPSVFCGEDNLESLMYSDSEFLMNVRQKKYSFDIHLTGYKTLLALLKNDFRTPYILNHDLLCYLIDNGLEEYLNEIFSQFENTDYNKLNFLLSFFKKHTDKTGYILKKIRQNQYDLWDTYVNNLNKFSDDDGIYLVTKILYQKDYIDCIKNISSLKTFLENIFILDKNSLNVLFENKTVRENILKIKPRFKNIEIFNKSNIEFIYKNNLYSFSPNNVNTITNQDTIDFNILKDDNNTKPLYNYIANNLCDFCEEYYLIKDDKINSQELIMNIINDKKIKISVKQVLYERETFKLRNIDKIEKELYESLVKYDHLNISWKNIIDLYKEIDISILFEYTTNNLGKLLNRVVPTENEKKVKSFFKNYILYLVKIDLNNAQNVIKLNKPLYEEINDLNAEELKILIQNNCLMFTKNIYKYITKTLTSSERYTYILNGFNSNKKLTDILNLFLIEDLEMLLYSDEINNNQKIELLYGFYKKEKRVDNLKAYENFIERIKQSFNENKVYEINNNKTIYNAILRRLKQEDIFKLFEVSDDKIRFKL